MARSAPVSRLLLLGHQAQVVYLASEALLQAYAQRSHEGFDRSLIDAGTGVGDQDTQGLRAELAIQVETADHRLRRRRALVRTIEAVLGLLLELRLDLAAMATKAKSGTGSFDSRHRVGFGATTGFAEIHVTEDDLLDEFETERGFSRGDLVGQLDIVRLEIRHQLTDVELRLTVVVAVIDTHLGVIAGCDRLAEAEQVPDLSHVGPHRVAARRADA